MSKSGVLKLALRIMTGELLMLATILLPGALRAQSRVESRVIQSKILGHAVHYTVLLPPSFDSQKTRRYPILYYLRGLGDNDQSLARLGGWDLVQKMQEEGQIGEFLIATPDGGRSFYINSRDGEERYEDFFMQEFMPEVEHRYRAIGTRAARGISGTSMGGYGALRYAFRYPNLFAAVSAHMPAIAKNLPAVLQAGLGQKHSPFGQPFDTKFWNENSPYTLAQQHAQAIKSLKIYFDCGRSDDYGFNVGSQELHDLLTKLGVPHEFHLYPGNHSGEYVAAHFPASLRFQAQAIGPKITPKAGIKERARD
jgi:S-formylglutathione hydrolase FrmB